MNRFMTLTALVGLAMALAGGGPAFAQDGVPSAIDAHLERIELYRTAIRAQQAAIDACSRRSSEALTAYQGAMAKGDSDALAALDVACQTATQLMIFYLQRLIDTQQRLAGEHDALGTKYRGLEEFGLAESSYVIAGDTWEKVAEDLSAQAEQSARDGNLHDSGSAYERAAGFCEKAAGSWRQALSCTRALGSAANDLTYGNRAATALAGQRDMLRNAVRAYYSAYQQHKALAATDKGDLNNRQIGEAWLRAARSHEQYERLAQRLAAMPE
jgi:hypothetical protein